MVITSAHLRARAAPSRRLAGLLQLMVTMTLSTCVSRVFALLGVLMALAGPASAQQVYPSKPIRIILTVAAGGSATVFTRLIGQKLTDSWGQPVLVDNRPGGNTIIGTEAVAKSPPDGHTILLASAAFVTLPSLVPHLPYDAMRDFAPVATLVGTEFLLALHPSVPANNLQEFIALARSRPGQFNFASAATGGPTHLAGELFNMMAGVKTQHVPYKGAGQILPDLLGGQVQFSFIGPANVAAHINSGKLKGIAYSGRTRLPVLPEVPTFTEAGLPGFDVRTWYGIVAPAGTPKAIIDKMSTEIAKILAMPDVREKLLSQDAEPLISTPEQFAVLMKADMARYAKVIKAAGIKIE